jgi:hypothetical protein
MARKPNGHDERDQIVDLRRYRQSAERARKAPPPPSRGRGGPGQGEPFLGSRRNAGLILAVVLLVLLLLTLGPALF